MSDDPGRTEVGTGARPMLTPAQRLRVYAATGPDMVTITIERRLLTEAARGLEQDESLLRAVRLMLDTESAAAARQHRARQREETLQRVFLLEWLCVTCALVATLGLGMAA